MPRLARRVARPGAPHEVAAPSHARLPSEPPIVGAERMALGKSDVWNSEARGAGEGSAAEREGQGPKEREVEVAWVVAKGVLPGADPRAPPAGDITRALAPNAEDHAPSGREGSDLANPDVVAWVLASSDVEVGQGIRATVERDALGHGEESNCVIVIRKSRGADDREDKVICSGQRLHCSRLLQHT